MSELTFTPAELARELGCCIEIIDQLIDEGRLPHVRLSPRKVVIPKQALMEWLEDEARASTVLAELEVDGAHAGLHHQGAA